MFTPMVWRTRRELNRRLHVLRARLVRLAWAWTGEQTLAEDLVQETLVRAVRSRHTLSDPTRTDAWTIKIMHRVYLDHLKSACRREAPVDFSGDRTAQLQTAMRVDETPETSAAAHEYRLRVRRAVASLPVGQRQVVALIDLAEFSYADCAEILDIPVGTVMSRLNRGRAALRELLLGAVEPEADQGTLRIVR